MKIIELLEQRESKILKETILKPYSVIVGEEPIVEYSTSRVLEFRRALPADKQRIKAEVLDKLTKLSELKIFESKTVLKMAIKEWKSK